jgi:glyoxylase-like metal-dependent hydrolase (beta-lactamase superfamily II)
MFGKAASGNKGLIGLALLVIAAGIAGIFWFRPNQKPVAQQTNPEPPLLSPKACAVAPGIYLLGDTRPAAAYAVDTADGLVLIDSGVEDSAQIVTAQLAKLHLDIGRLRAILLTHVHGDHSLGAQQLRQRTGAKVYAGRADCAPLRRGGPREAFFSGFPMYGLEPHPTAVDVELTGEEILSFGESRIQVIATPGHTPGSICYLLERPDLRALFTGDVVSCLAPTEDGALGTYSAYMPPRYRGNAGDYLASLRRLRSLPMPDLVLPGHPDMDEPSQNPRLSSERWLALLDGGITEMERLLERYKADGADFLDGNPKELLPGLHYLGDCGRPIYCLESARRLLLFDAPGGSDLVAFLRARFEKMGWEKRKITAVLLTSGDERAVSGLVDVVKVHKCRVMAPKSAVDQIRSLCPPGTHIVDEGSLGEIGWFDGQAIALSGRGLAPLAYLLRWKGKNVLVSGSLPIKPNNLTIEQLRLDLQKPSASIEKYRQSLNRLQSLRPDLWLPAVPVNGQNANLYDNAWKKILDDNRRMLLHF